MIIITILIIVNYYGHKQTALIGLPCLLEIHTSENLYSYIKLVIKCYNIGDKLGYFMIDNAGDNNDLMELLANDFEMINPDRDYLHCASHIINLVVKAILFGNSISKLQCQLASASDAQQFDIWSTKSTIGKLHNICIYLNRNNARCKLLKKKLQQVADDNEIYTYVLLTDGSMC